MGFFFQEYVDNKKDPKRLPSIVSQGCTYCPLDLASKTLVHPKMPSSGSDHPSLYITGEAPGGTEDEQGVPFVGESGRLLRAAIPKDILPEVRFDNAVRCRPSISNRTPSEVEVNCCKVHLFNDIAKYQPRLILALGSTALKSLIGESDITGWRGRLVVVTIGGHRTWLTCTYHPSFILRRLDERNNTGGERNIFNLDIAAAVKLVRDGLEPPEPLPPILDGIATTTDAKVVSRFLAGLTIDQALDLETSGLRPYNKTARILSVAIGTFNKTLAFPLDHPALTAPVREVINREFRNFLLERREVPLWCHNLAFELEWLGKVYGQEVMRNRRWDDTMLQARALDSRTGMYSLDALIKMYFGFSEKSVVKVNTSLAKSNPTAWLQTPLDLLLQYNGLDSKWTHKLSEVQGERLGREPTLGVEYERLRRTAPTLVAAQMRGLVPDFKRAEELEKDLRLDEERLLKKIDGEAEVAEYRKRFGPFSPSSPPQVGRFLKNILGIQTTSADEKVLAAIGPEVSHVPALILQYRQALKMRSTYTEPITARKIIYDDDLIHTSIHQHTTRTGRTSSDEPNIQNYPKRKRAEVRAVISCPEGHVLTRFDFGQIEARVLAMESEDKNFCDKLRANYDIHGDWAKRLKQRCPSIMQDLGVESDESLRDAVKNNFVFALFYGARPESTSNRLKIPLTLAMKLVDEFWDEFPGIKAWHKKIVSRYEKLGYVETLLGRRRGGVLSLNEIINTPTQGSASDIVVDGMNRLSEYSFDTHQPQFQAVINVHDELCFYQPKETLEQDMRTTAEMLVVSPLPFVIVPLTVSASYGENWYEQNKAGTYQTTDFDRTTAHQIPAQIPRRSVGARIHRTILRAFSREG